MALEEKKLHAHGNVVCSCIWKEAEEDMLVTGDHGSAQASWLCSAHHVGDERATHWDVLKPPVWCHQHL